MALSADDLTRIEALLGAAEADAQTLVALRRQFPGLSLTRCDASDVIEEPFRSFAAYDLHLMDVSDHCPVVVSDPAAASGLILAARSVAK